LIAEHHPSLKSLNTIPPINRMSDDIIPKFRVNACFLEDDSSYNFLMFEIEVVKLIGIKPSERGLNAVPKIIIHYCKFPRSRSILLVGESSLSFEVNRGNLLCWQGLRWLELPIMKIFDKALISLSEANIFVAIRIVELEVLCCHQLFPILF
jgi:hypothetical protein